MNTTKGGSANWSLLNIYNRVIGNNHLGGETRRPRQSNQMADETESGFGCSIKNNNNFTRKRSSIHIDTYREGSGGVFTVPKMEVASSFPNSAVTSNRGRIVPEKNPNIFSSNGGSGGSESELDSYSGECFKCFWCYLRFARCFGLCPISKERTTSNSNAGSHDMFQLIRNERPNIQWINNGLALTIQGIMFSNSLYIFIVTWVKNEKSELLGYLNSLIYFSHSLFNCLFMTVRVKRLPKLLDACRKVENICHKYRRKEDANKMVKHCQFFVYIGIGLQILANILYFYSISRRYNTKTFAQFVASFNEELGHVNVGNAYSGFFFWIGGFYCDLGWTFTDILLSIISIVCSRYFDRLNKILEAKAKNLNPIELEGIRIDHREISNLVKICNDLFSPLFLVTYLANTAYLFIRLHESLTYDLMHTDPIVRLEGVYAFAFQIAKIFVPTYLASILHEKSHKALDSVHSMPSEVESAQSNFRTLVIGRFISQLSTQSIGVEGCGFFIVSKSFFVTLISAFLTYEIVIIQFQVSGSSNNNKV